MEKFIQKHGNKEAVNRLVKLQKYGPSLKKQHGREIAKKAIDDEKVYIEVRNILIDIFENVYRKNKTEINNNMLKLLGFDGADDMYLAVQTDAGKPIEVLSSRSSKEFQSILKKLTEDFDIKFDKSDTVVNTSVRFYSGKTELFKSQFGFRDLDKVSNFVNLKAFK